MYNRNRYFTGLLTDCYIASYAIIILCDEIALIVWFTFSMISSTFPAATMSGLMIATVTAFLVPSVKTNEESISLI